ncbi:MAG: gephyrin-like molybdotransferase Glp, partial [Chloroflexota bacterium]
VMCDQAMTKENQFTTTLKPVHEACQYILSCVNPLAAETVPITRALNRILATDIQSDCQIPPFANSAMDGYALQAEDIQNGSADHPIKLKVIENVQAGVVPQHHIQTGTAARIMTGAPLPQGANAVVRFEDTSEASPIIGLAADEIAILQAVPFGENVRHAGEDIRLGQMVMRKGHRLRPQDVGVLASIGCQHVSVYRLPRVAILATGDELVGIDEPVVPGKIRNSNEYTQAALVQSYGAEPVMLGVARDTKQDLTAKIQEGLDQKVDLFLTSAGVSVGDYDIVKDVLAAEGAMHFWQVAMKPGKPLAFGLIQDVPIIGLPGNPVASMIAFEVFARPAILKLAGATNLDTLMIKATLQEDVYNSGRQHYMRASVRYQDGQYQVTTRGSGVRVQGSGILSSLVWANALLVVPSEVMEIPEGAEVDVWLLDWRGEPIPTVSNKS